jgi:hypothetical protein
VKTPRKSVQIMATESEWLLFRTEAERQRLSLGEWFYRAAIVAARADIGAPRKLREPKPAQ